MIWTFGLVVPFLVFFALARFRVTARRRALPHVQVPSDAAPLRATGSSRQNMVAIEPASFPLDALRDTMKLDDTNLFAPLHVALVDLIRHGRCLEGELGVKLELSALEARLRSFEDVAGAMAAEAPTGTTADLRKLLHAIGEVVLRIWDIFKNSVNDGAGDPPLQSVEDFGKVKILLQQLESILAIFEMDDNRNTKERLSRISQVSYSPDSSGTTDFGPPTSIVNQNSNMTVIVGDGSVTNDNWVINAISIIEQQEKAIEIITNVFGQQFVFEAADDAQPSIAGCMSGTRTRVLSESIAWAIGETQKIYWISGMAGTGKSSIAITLCRMLRNEPAVFFGGGFFCSRSSNATGRKDVRRVLPTLARLMAHNSPDFATALAGMLDKTDLVASKPVHEQIGPLLSQPLSRLAQSHRPIVFLIDALDEFSNERELAQLLQLIVDFQTDVRVKFILTSRPETHIRRTIVTNPGRHMILKLHDIDLLDVQQDIHLYISRTLAELAKGATWYTDADVETLVRLSDGLFIFATTALDYVLGPDEDDDRSARLFRATSAVPQGTAVTFALDAMYEPVVTAAFKSSNIDADELDQLKYILACIVGQCPPLTVRALASLTNFSPGILRMLLQRLHAFVLVPDDDDEPNLRTVHVSFGDYLCNRAPNRIFISGSPMHEDLAPDLSPAHG